MDLESNGNVSSNFDTAIRLTESIGPATRPSPVANLGHPRQQQISPERLDQITCTPPPRSDPRLDSRQIYILTAIK